MRIQLHRRKLLAFAATGALLLCGAVFALAWSSDRIGTHPVFGAIRQTIAADLNDARPDPVGRFLRKYLPARLVYAPGLPYHFKDQPRYLRIGGFPLEWSIGGSDTGWLYFWTPGFLPRYAAWEFAPSTATNLLQLTKASIPERFYAHDDPILKKAFGSMSTTNALHVKEGQVLFARRTADTNTIYVLQLARQEGNRLFVEYCACRP